MSRSAWLLLLKGGVSAALMTWLLTRTPLDQLAQAVAGANPWLLAAALGITLVGWAINSFKWQLLLAPLGFRRELRELFTLNLIGVFYSLVLPGQVGGEVMKGLRLARSGIPAGPVAVSITVDRLTGIGGFATLGLLGLLAAPATPVKDLLLGLAAMVLVLACLPLVFVVHAPKNADAVETGWVARLRGTFMSLWQVVGSYRSAPTTLLAAALLSLAFQALVTLSNYWAAQALGIDISFLALLWIVAAVSLVHLLPVALAGLGVREGAYVFFLQQYGVAPAAGLALSLTVFGIILAQALLGGLLEAGLPKAAARLRRQEGAPRL